MAMGLLGSRRSTAFSPMVDGTNDTRTSNSLLPKATSKRPSCGRRFCAMSSLERILMREITWDAR